MNKVYLATLLIFLSSCGRFQGGKSELQKNDSIIDTRDSLRNKNVLTHEHHVEDEDVPWSDTPKIGKWIELDYLNRLIDIHKNVSSTSLLKYITTTNQSDTSILNIEIEGCAAEDAFYLKDLSHGHTYVAKSSNGILESDTFKLIGYANRKNYVIAFPNSSELYLNSKKFVENRDQTTLNMALTSNYKLYDNKGHLLDSIHYNGQMVFNSDTIYTMSLINYLGSNDLDKIIAPIIANADFMALSLYTGKLKNETKEPEFIGFVYEIIRTNNGFELHNRRETPFKNERDKVHPGLHFRFEKMK